MGAIEYLHSMSIVHRDMKPDNVLFESTALDSRIKIADYGFARIINFEGELMKTVCGTPTFVAPEIICCKVRREMVAVYDKACDVWSCGVILFCILSGELGISACFHDFYYSK
mmetsp:Transcript_16155/g.43850  ORF Transcript_16155/g.43850 Transcript_16155/m.43850 type:complete len:113 (+) Transcript_16155:497-835(+)